MVAQLRAEIVDPHLVHPALLQRIAVEPERGQIGEVDAVVDRLERGGIPDPVGLHRIGEDEIAAWLEHPRNLAQHHAAIGRVQDGILAPDDIEAGILERQIVERSFHHGNPVFQALLGGQLAVARVFGRRDVEAGDMACIVLACDPPRAAAVACPDVEHLFA